MLNEENNMEISETTEIEGNISEPETAQSEIPAESSDLEVDSVMEEEPEKKNPIASVYECLETFCYALAAIMVLFLFVFRLVTVDGNSMRETLHDQDKLIISDMFYTPKTGDIVVISPENSSPIIKRVIATGGQKVFIDYDKWEVYVDGEKLDEPYIQAMRKEWGKSVGMTYTDVDKYKKEFVVDEGKVFVMGDNRNGSSDSRDSKYGELSEDRILGRVVVRISPNFGFVD